MNNRETRRPHRAVILAGLVTLLYAVPVLWGLGAVEFFGDEGIVALGGKRVLHFGYPRAWDGVNLFSFEAGHDLNDHLIQRRLPWLAFYISAAGQWFFGENNFGARFGFALCGILNLPLLYWTGRRMGLSRSACLASVLVLASLAGYFLYIRQAYHYSADITFSLLGLACYLRIERRWNPVLLSLCVLALFHLNYLTAMWFALTIVLLAIWNRQFPVLLRRRTVWTAISICLAGTAGWIGWASVLEFQETLGGWETFLPHLNRLGFVLSELDMSFPLLATLPVLAWCGKLGRFDENIRRLHRLSICTLAGFLCFASYQYAWLRFFLFIFAVFAWIWGVFLAWLWPLRQNTAAVIAALMFLTVIPHQLSHQIVGCAWPSWARFSMNRLPLDEETPRIIRLLARGMSPMLVEVPVELATPPVTHWDEVLHCLNQLARPGEKIVSLCDSEIIQFRTRLITAYLVDRRQNSYPKVAHLPSYVASYREADWLVLHNHWKRNFGMMELGEINQNEEILSWFRSSGVVLVPVPLWVREHFPNQLPNLWGHTWRTDIGRPVLQLYRVHRPKQAVQ